MEDTSQAIIEGTLSRQRQFFKSGKSRSLAFRKEQLDRLQSALHQWEGRLAEALWKDLHKSYEEAYLTEFSLIYQEIRVHRRHLKTWSRSRPVPTPLHLMPSASRIGYEPLGVALIVTPWNYPVQLMLTPLIGAISSGCCVMLKPSRHAPSVALTLEEMIHATFEPDYISIVQGGRSVNTFLFGQPFDLIFFTGSPKLGRLVMQAAAPNLTPIVLELGGKSPVIVDRGANLEVAANRIAFGKILNAGQTCIAPDYLLVHQSLKEAFLKKLTGCFDRMLGPDIKANPHYGRIVNDKSVNRLIALMDSGTIIYGGEVDPAERYIAPTVIDEISCDDPIMQEEIFGPLLPVITFSQISEAIRFINSNEKPLALYYFGKQREAIEVLNKTSSGGACLNDTILHVANHHLPFGGVGNSGMGRYHGQESFLAFSHRRAVLDSPTWFDLPVKYPPYRGFKWIKKIL